MLYNLMRLEKMIENDTTLHADALIDENDPAI
jgi:hypothetical protein